MSYKNSRILCSVGMRGDCSTLVKESMLLALATDSNLHILHVVKSLSDDLLGTLRNNIHNPKRLTTLLAERTHQWQEELEELLEQFWVQNPEIKEKMKDHSVSISVEEGYPSAVICNYAEQGNFNMIIVAANKQRYPAVYAGKVTKGVIKRAKVPVVVVPTTC